MTTTEFTTGYNTGYTDHAAGKPNAYPPIIVGPTPVLARVIQPTEDFAAVINGLSGGENLELVPGAGYRALRPIATLAGNWKLNAKRASITFADDPDASSLFRIQHAGIEVSQVIAIAEAANAHDVLFYVVADNFTFRDSIVKDGFGKVGEADKGGTNATFQNIDAGKTFSCSIYTSQHGTKIKGGSYKGSIGETTLRVSTGPNGPANGVIIDGVEIFGGGFNKGAMEWRGAGTGCQFTRNKVHDYVRWGQGTATEPGQFIKRQLVAGNTFHLTAPANPQMLIMSGVNLDVIGNLLWTDQDQLGAAIANDTSVRLSGNQLLLTDSSKPNRAKFWVTQPRAVVTDDGTTIIVPFAAPKVPPASNLPK